jgi:hypothetical protein
MAGQAPMELPRNGPTPSCLLNAELVCQLCLRLGRFSNRSSSATAWRLMDI